MQIRLALNQLDEAALLTKKCMRGVARADPAARAILLHGLTDYFTRVREWDRATEIWEQLQDDDLLAESALIGLVEINAARALSAIQSGLEALAIRRKNFDPDTEIVIPGNDKLRWDKTEKKLQHHRKWIEKVLPKERQKAFGFKVQ
jgi:hypothetical protein